MSPNNEQVEDPKGEIGGWVSYMERWTREGGFRKIGNGPWKRIDLTPFGGRVPFLILDPKIHDWELSEMVSLRQAMLMRKL